MYLFLAGVGILTFVIVYNVFRKPTDAMDVCEMSDLDPRNPIYDEYCILHPAGATPARAGRLPALRKDRETRPQKASGSMHSHKKPTSCIAEAGDQFPRSPDSEPYIIR